MLDSIQQIVNISEYSAICLNLVLIHLSFELVEWKFLFPLQENVYFGNEYEIGNAELNKIDEIALVAVDSPLSYL
jgi:hypothetical protein